MIMDSACACVGNNCAPACFPILCTANTLYGLVFLVNASVTHIASNVPITLTFFALCDILRLFRGICVHIIV